MKIRQIKITPGVEWVEIEDLGLRILCGCPADIVKHLMRRGLIIDTIVGDVPAETGPNTILISDMTLQSGEFCDLAEFPVLQMLYKQGMLLPGHPNNTGRKPLLMGLENQLRAQLNYIHRGNYGLISKEELLATGMDDDLADRMMRIKTHFAFGEIRRPSELLDCLPLDHHETEIAKGVTIKRITLNKYRLDYDGEHVIINMNLPEGESYKSPYPLGMHHVSREYFSVIHSGEGDGWDIDRPCMGSLLSFQGKLYLIDAGPNLGAILNSLSLSVNELDGIFHTHCHDDHFAGLTALLQSDHKLRYYATPYVRSAVTKKLSALLSIDEEEFGNYFDISDLVTNVWQDIGGLGVMPVVSPHPVENTIFKFSVLGPKGHYTYNHLADIAADRILDDMVDNATETSGMTPEYCEEVKQEYRSYASLKKIDIGGGMIHGDAVDFADDPSNKLVLAHLNRDLTTEERKIGSGAEFGTADVLIPASQDYLRRQAYRYLQSYFPTLSNSKLQILLNNRLRKLNPHEILMQQGEPVGELLLVLSGNAEEIRGDSHEVVRLAAGDFLGELPALQGTEANATLRATSFLSVLVIPSEQYLAFIDQYADRRLIEDLARKRLWLRNTWLFNEGLSYPVHNRVANSMVMSELDDGLVPENADNENVLRILDSGVVKRFLDDNVLETIRAGDFFNEGRAIFNVTPKSHWMTIGNAQVWDISADIIADIPIVRWKMLETFRRRIQTVRDANFVAPVLEAAEA